MRKTVDELDAPNTLYVREAWGKLADEVKEGKVVSVDVANHYARRGSHWIEYTRTAAIPDPNRLRKSEAYVWASLGVLLGYILGVLMGIFL